MMRVAQNIQTSASMSCALIKNPRATAHFKETLEIAG